MSVFLWILRLVLIFALVLFTVQNWMSVPLKFLHFYVELPLVFWVVVIFSIGVLFGLTLILPRHYRQHKHLKELKKKDSTLGL